MPGIDDGARRGRPADPGVETALRAAAFSVLAEHGWRGTTIDRIAEVAGVARTTVYRRYGSLHGIMLMLLDDVGSPGPAADTGSLRGDLIATAQATQALWSRRGRADYLSALTAARRESQTLAREIAEREHRSYTRWQPIVERAAARGELRAGADPELLLELILSALTQRVVRSLGPPDQDFVVQVVDGVLTGFGVPSASQSAGPSSALPGGAEFTRPPGDQRVLDTDRVEDLGRDEVDELPDRPRR